MSVNVSVRLEYGLAERLRVRARASGVSLSDRLRGYVVERVRADEHPMITFRDGPTGRRAGLVGGPDVWEIAMWFDEIVANGDDLGARVAESNLSRTQIDAALRYRSAYPEEISARIELHRQSSAAADAL